VYVTNKRVVENVTDKIDLPLTSVHILSKEDFIETNNLLTVQTKPKLLNNNKEKDTSHQKRYYSHRIGTKSLIQGFACKTSVIPRSLNFASSSRKTMKNVDNRGQLINEQITLSTVKITIQWITVVYVCIFK